MSEACRQAAAEPCFLSAPQIYVSMCRKMTLGPSFFGILTCYTHIFACLLDEYGINYR
jgi:hypothetical protein